MNIATIPKQWRKWTIGDTLFSGQDVVVMWPQPAIVKVIQDRPCKSEVQIEYSVPGTRVLERHWVLYDEIFISTSEE